MVIGGGFEQTLAAAMAHHRAGRLNEAERLYRVVCDGDPQHARAFHLLGVVAHQLKRPDAAALVGRAVMLQPDFAEAHNDRGVILAAQGAFVEALACFEKAVSLKSGYTEARNNLARGLRALGRLEEALAQFELVLAEMPASPLAHFNLASALEWADRKADAEKHYRAAVSLRGDFFDAHLQLAALLQASDRTSEALAHAERAVTLRPDSAGARNNFGNILRSVRRHDEAIAQYETALRIDPSFFMAHYNCGVALRGETRILEARDHFAQAFALKPDFLEAELALCVAELPALYRDASDILRQRAAYADRLARLSVDIAKAAKPAALADAIGSHQPFYLPYQGFDDRELQTAYGTLVCEIMADRYERSALPSRPAPQEPIKLGIVSGFFRQHSNWKVPIKGWLKMLDRDRFRIFGYHTGVERDSETAVAANLCERFVEGPLSLDAWRRVILEDTPHVLLFPEIGMDKGSAQLAAQRLAEVQCVAWGHPVTSGFPTIDYFISSELMEPPNAATHYSENLIRLPNLSIYYEPLEIAPAEIERAKLGLRPDAVVYWCAQSLPKYLPQFDAVFPRIAVEVPNCQFTFIEFGGGRGITEIFKSRLESAFEALGLNTADHCVFLPRLSPERFAAAIGACDVVLDSIGWSGCNSILESLIHSLPIVTFEGAMMRGRHAAAILNMMNVHETTARSVDEYISIASALGRHEKRRKGVSSQIAANKHRVCRDLQCIAGLQSFLEEAVRKPKA